MAALRIRNRIVYYVGKLVVAMHYAHWFNIHELPSLHNPERYKRTQKKAQIPTGYRWQVWRRDFFTCIYCNDWGHNLSLDHVVPEVHGGLAVPDNLVTACIKCNTKKGTKTFEEFLNSKWLENRKKKNIQRLLTTHQPAPLQEDHPTLLQNLKTIGVSNFRSSIRSEESSGASRKHHFSRSSCRSLTGK